MVGVGILKTGRGMAVAAFNVGFRVVSGWGVGGAGCFTSSYSAVVATDTCPGNICMIKAAI